MNEAARALAQQAVIDYCHEQGGNLGFRTAVINAIADRFVREGWVPLISEGDLDQREELMGDHETTSEGPDENKVDAGATTEHKTEDPALDATPENKHPDAPDGQDAPGPSFGGDQPDGTNDNQPETE